MATWIPIDDDLPNHHKTARLRRLTGVKTKREAISFLVSLWLYTLKVAWRDADLSAYGVEGIEEELEWSGEPGKLVHALQNCGKPGPDGTLEPGFLERGTLVVHGWVERNSKLIRDRIYREDKRRAEGAGQDSALGTEVMDRWNKFADSHGLPKVARAGALPAGVDLDAFEKALEMATTQPYLLGKGPEGWRMSLGWLLQSDHFQKVQAGAYITWKKKPGEASGSPEPGRDYRGNTKKLLEARAKKTP